MKVALFSQRRSCSTVGARTSAAMKMKRRWSAKDALVRNFARLVRAAGPSGQRRLMSGSALPKLARCAAIRP